MHRPTSVSIVERLFLRWPLETRCRSESSSVRRNKHVHNLLQYLNNIPVHDHCEGSEFHLNSEPFRWYLPKSSETYQWHHFTSVSHGQCPKRLNHQKTMNVHVTYLNSVKSKCVFNSYRLYNIHFNEFGNGFSPGALGVQRHSDLRVNWWL